MIKPLGDRVILQVQEVAEQTIGGIVLASNAQEKPVAAQVVAVSETTVGDLLAPSAVKVGETVIFDKYAGQEIHVDGADYIALHEKDIIAII